jgi:hypothetical protein
MAASPRQAEILRSAAIKFGTIVSISKKRTNAAVGSRRNLVGYFAGSDKVRRRLPANANLLSSPVTRPSMSTSKVDFYPARPTTSRPAFRSRRQKAALATLARSSDEFPR